MKKIALIVLFFILIPPINAWGYELKLLPMGQVQECNGKQQMCYTLEQTKELFLVDSDCYHLKLEAVSLHQMVKSLQKSLMLANDSIVELADQNTILFEDKIKLHKDFTEYKKKTAASNWNWLPWGIVVIETAVITGMIIANATN